MRRGRRLTAPVDLRGLPRGTVRVTVVAPHARPAGGVVDAAHVPDLRATKRRRRG